MEKELTLTGVKACILSVPCPLQSSKNHLGMYMGR